MSLFPIVDDSPVVITKKGFVKEVGADPDTYEEVKNVRTNQDIDAADSCNYHSENDSMSADDTEKPIAAGTEGTEEDKGRDLLHKHFNCFSIVGGECCIDVECTNGDGKIYYEEKPSKAQQVNLNSFY